MDKMPPPAATAADQNRAPAADRLGAMVLAAGASVRLGTPKQLLVVGGQPLLVRAVETALASPVWPVVVVLGAHAEQIRPTLARYPVIVVENPAWPEGMASSLRTGITTLQQFSRQLDGALIALCDQPAFSTEVITRLMLARQTRGCSIAAARYAGHLGVPAIFGKRHFHELAELTGEQGARALLTEHAADVTALDLPDLAVDIDTMADFEAYRKGQSSTP